VLANEPSSENSNSERTSLLIKKFDCGHKTRTLPLVGVAGLLGSLDFFEHSFSLAFSASSCVLNGPAIVLGVFSWALITLQFPFLSLITT